MIIKIILIIIGIYFLLLSLLFFFQEKIIFHPHKLSKDHKFNFNMDYEELNIETKDGILLNGLLFKSNIKKGVIFYLHGNAGSLESWGEVARLYTDLNYDVFILDYRGFGKSGGKIINEEQLFSDNQLAYNEILKRYSEKNVIILGYSIGTGLSAKLASENKPKLLILQAPYYSLIDVMKHSFSFIPEFILKYKLETNKYLRNCKMPIIVFHGDKDKVIYYASSIKLKKDNKMIKLITLKQQGHNGITDNSEYIKEIKEILTSKTMK